MCGTLFKELVVLIRKRKNYEKTSQLDKTFLPDKASKSTSGKAKQPEIKTAITKAQTKAIKKRNEATNSARTESQEFDPDEAQMVGDLSHIFNLN